MADSPLAKVWDAMSRMVSRDLGLELRIAALEDRLRLVDGRAAESAEQIGAQVNRIIKGASTDD